MLDTKDRCPRKFIVIVRQFHDDILVRVQDNGETTEPFSVSNGVKQGCVIVSTLFSLMFSAMLTDAFRDTNIDIGIRYQTVGSVFNLRRVQAKKTSFQQTPSTTSCLRTTVPSTIPRKPPCSTAWTGSLTPVTILA